MLVERRPRGWNPLEGENQEAGSRRRFLWLGEVSGHQRGRRETAGREGGQRSCPVTGSPADRWALATPETSGGRTCSGGQNATSPLAWGGWPGGGCPAFPVSGLPSRVVQPLVGVLVHSDGAGARGLGRAGAIPPAVCPREAMGGLRLRFLTLGSQRSCPVTGSSNIRGVVWVCTGEDTAFHSGAVNQVTQRCS